MFVIDPIIHNNHLQRSEFVSLVTLVINPIIENNHLQTSEFVNLVTLVITPIIQNNHLQTSELYWDTTAGINQMDANCRQQK